MHGAPMAVGTNIRERKESSVKGSQRLTIYGWIIVGLVLGLAHTGWTSTGTTLDGATAPFQSLFLLGVFLLGGAGLATIVYTVAMNRYGVIWDQALSVIFAVAIGSSFLVVLGWVGSTAASPLPPPSAYEEVMPQSAPGADGDVCPMQP